LGTWEGTIDRETAIWVRFYDVAGNLVLLPEEAAKLHAEAAKLHAEAAKLHAEIAQLREEEAKAKAARLAARLRELGENPDML
jgi:cell division protein FtsB